MIVIPEFQIARLRLAPSKTASILWPEYEWPGYADDVLDPPEDEPEPAPEKDDE